MREITGTARYEYRYWDETIAAGVTGWMDAGNASPETLSQIRAGLIGRDYEVRQVSQIADDNGNHIGQIIYAQLVESHEEE